MHSLLVFHVASRRLPVKVELTQLSILKNLTFTKMFTDKLRIKFYTTCYRYVYMAELGGKRLSIYTRESDNSLTLKQVRRVISVCHKRDG